MHVLQLIALVLALATFVLGRKFSIVEFSECELHGSRSLAVVHPLLLSSSVGGTSIRAARKNPPLAC
jgi:hypothetical protein